jgi:hypothetical protein
MQCVGTDLVSARHVSTTRSSNPPRDTPISNHGDFATKSLYFVLLLRRTQHQQG